MRQKIESIRFLPPIAVARVGDSDSPLEAFTWEEDPRPFGAAKTIIAPCVSLEVLPNGTVEPYNPGPVRFRDGLSVRPVCPFFELWARVEASATEVPLTGNLIEDAGLDLSQLHFLVVAANLKGQRQTNDPSCSFEARLEVRANDHRRHDLWAWTHAPGDDPLVLRERPVWLGAFQVIRPVRRSPKFGVIFDVIRVRFTPGRGAVYGPPTAKEGFAQANRAAFEIVPPENRILNQNSIWCRYDNRNVPYSYTSPNDVYDGNDDLDRRPIGWGVVDDSCDALVTASFATYFGKMGPPRPTCSARVLVGPPHYSPDRRHIFSLADDLADRNPEALADRGREPEAWTAEEWLEVVVDIFRRAAETASQINVERHRDLSLFINSSGKNLPGFPSIDHDSMTPLDKIDGKDGVKGKNMMSFRFAALAGADQGDAATDAPLLPKAEYARTRHAELTVPRVLVEYLIRNPHRVREIIRPPYRRLSDAPVAESKLKSWDYRDPRRPRSLAFDARMPPFIRDAYLAPLSLTRRQYDLLISRVEDPKFMSQVLAALDV